MISIHALRTEGDRRSRLRCRRQAYFYPRPPYGGRRQLHGDGVAVHGISIHALRTEGDENQLARPFTAAGISIHALRTEGDLLQINCFHLRSISIHALRTEGDPSFSNCTVTVSHISIHALRTEGDFHVSQFLGVGHISIHALRTEGDVSQNVFHFTAGTFLSTPSVRRATLSAQVLLTQGMNFYPRPPYGGRPAPCRLSCDSTIFLSTPSVRRATRPLTFNCCISLFISIHALRTEGDRLGIQAISEHKTKRFLSTPSVRRATCFTSCFCGSRVVFLSTPSVRRATAKVHKMLFAFAAQTRKFVVLILQNTHSLLRSKLFRALLHHFSTIFWCEGPSAFLCASCSHPLQQQHIIL